jgi:hypothetical protein
MPKNRQAVYMTWPELVGRELDRRDAERPKPQRWVKGVVVVEPDRFPHVCAGVGCAICRWLERPQ